LAARGETLPYGSSFSGSDIVGHSLLALTQALAAVYGLEITFRLEFVCEKEYA
jgi:hypothetical protein